MAKNALTAAVAVASGASAEGVTVGDLTRKQRTTLEAIKAEITGRGGFARDLGAIRERTKDIAPRVMRFFGELLTMMGPERLTWVGFVRLIDPTVPTHPRMNKAGEEGYQNHATYYALSYIKQRWNTQLNPERVKGQQGQREPAFDVPARAIRTILKLAGIEPSSPSAAIVFDAWRVEFNVQKRTMDRLVNRVKDAEPILDVKGIKPVPLTAGNIHHMEPHSKAVEAIRGRSAAASVVARGVRGALTRSAARKLAARSGLAATA